MATSTKRSKPSEETVTEAMRIARATQRPGQTKEQTKLIAQGIQKGIDQYKKQQKAKAREMDKRRKKNVTDNRPDVDQPTAPENELMPASTNPIPWVLLAVSWGFFAFYLLFFAR